MTLYYILVIVGLGCLFAGGEMLIRGAVATARALGVSPLLIGLTVVGFGTSSPELVVSVNAALSDSAAIALGNVVGSNIANVLLVLGLAATLSPLACPSRVIFRDGMAVLAVTLAFALLVVVLPAIDRAAGLVLLALLGAYVAWSYHADVRGAGPASLHRNEADELASLPRSRLATGAFLAGGLVLLVGGAHLLVSGAVRIAESLGVPEVVIGLTLVAVGTSLPELAISVLAAIRRHADVAVGNILGSNLFNLLGIIGVTATVAPVPVDPRIAAVDVWVMLGAVVLVLPMMFTGRRLGRVEGALLLAAYVAYLAAMLAGSDPGAQPNGGVMN